MPAYVKAFDVGLVPYKIAEYTANVYPTKLNEYLVMGTPVVATDLAEIRRFNATTASVVHIAAGVDDFDAGDSRGARRHATRRAVSRAPGGGAEQQLAQPHERDGGADRRGARRAARRASSGGRPRCGASTAAPAATPRRVVLGVAAAYLLVFQTNAGLVGWPSRCGCRSPPARGRCHRRVCRRRRRVGPGRRRLPGAGEAGGRSLQGRLRAALILSSGYVYSFKEAEVMRALAIDHGVPADRIVLETAGRPTPTRTSSYATDILRERNWRRILLVSSPYHMRRAMLAWHKVAPDVTVVPAPPAAGAVLRSHQRAPRLEQVRGILQEYAAIAVYWWRGWV